MKKRIEIILRILFGGALLFASSSNGCLADALRDVADEIEELEDDDKDLGDVWDDLESWF
jgi:hypothetical protein